jgi:hypothetical protein
MAQAVQHSTEYFTMTRSIKPKNNNGSDNKEKRIENDINLAANFLLAI